MHSIPLRPRRYLAARGHQLIHAKETSRSTAHSRKSFLRFFFAVTCIKLTFIKCSSSTINAQFHLASLLSTVQHLHQRSSSYVSALNAFKAQRPASFTFQQFQPCSCLRLLLNVQAVSAFYCPAAIPFNAQQFHSAAFSL